MPPEAVAPSRESFDSDIGPAPCSDPCLPPGIRAVELTQGIQYLPLDVPGPRANTLPLISGKDLIVRVFVPPELGDPRQRFHAAVVATSRRGRQTRHVALGSLLLKDAAGPRTAAASSLNVQIPGGRVAEGMSLHVTLYRLAQPGRWEHLASHSLLPRVIAVPPLPVVIVPVALNVSAIPDRTGRSGVAPPAQGDGTGVLEAVCRRLPVPSIDLRAYTPPRVFDVTWADAPKEVRAALLAQDLASTRDLVVVGVIGADYKKLGPPTYGFGGSGVAVAVDADPHAVVHEIGHVLRRRHNPCAGGVSDPRYPGTWPREPGALDEVGFRIGDDDGVGPPEALDPDGWFDYMGAATCRPAWSSAYGWTVAMRGVRGRAWRRRPPCVGRWMLLDVTVSGPDQAALGPSHVVKARPPAPLGPPSGYNLEVRDACRILARHVLHRLDLVEGGSATFPARFIQAIPWSPGATELRVRHGSRLVETLPLAAAPPALVDVQVLTASSGNEQVELRWSGDSGPGVSHLVRYSNDGDEWIALSNDMRENPAVLDLRGLPTGPACVIEVAASSGGRTTVLRSAPFARDPVTPQAVIALPQPTLTGAPVRLPLNSFVNLSGFGFSADAAPTRDDALTWVVEDAGNVETELGTGGNLIVAARTLPAGVSRIHLRLAGGAADHIDVRRGGSGGPSPVAGP